MNNKAHHFLFVMALLLSVVACHQNSDKIVLAKEKHKDFPKFDATRIVNKVLDSTDIARLYGFDKDGTFAIYRNDFIKKYNVQITSKRYYLSDDCDSLEKSIEARMHKCWFLEFIQIDSISKDIYRLHFALPYKCKGGYYDFNINDYSILDSLKRQYRPNLSLASDTIRYVIWNDNKSPR